MPMEIPVQTSLILMINHKSMIMTEKLSWLMFILPLSKTRGKISITLSTNHLLQDLASILSTTQLTYPLNLKSMINLLRNSCCSRKWWLNSSILTTITSKLTHRNMNKFTKSLNASIIWKLQTWHQIWHPLWWMLLPNLTKKRHWITAWLWAELLLSTAKFQK
jgi:hypothetical protein